MVVKEEDEMRLMDAAVEIGGIEYINMGLGLNSLVCVYVFACSIVFHCKEMVHLHTKVNSH